jgi:hypothetical protein
MRILAVTRALPTDVLGRILGSHERRHGADEDEAPESMRVELPFRGFGARPQYSGQTSLTIRPQDRRVLMLPAIDLGQGAILETVVLIQYKIRDEDDGETSRFEIN